MQHDRPDRQSDAGIAPVAGSPSATGGETDGAPALAFEPNILARFVEAQRNRRVIADPRAMQLVYLCLTSRVLERPVSLAIKGPSSAGKSFAVAKTLDFFPPSAYHALTSMSERALVYDVEPLVHRILVLYEAGGMGGEAASYYIRSLLSEGRVRYTTVVPTKDGPQPKTIEREGPTGLLTTTTAIQLHAENETRWLSVPVDGGPEQTRQILLAMADEGRVEVDLGEWRALQDWLQEKDHRVTIPYGRPLAELIPPVATRLNRDFGLVQNLIKAHAILHQIGRSRDPAGQIVATLEDYVAVRSLVIDLVSEGVGTTVSTTVRRTVNAVHELHASATFFDEDVDLSVTGVAKELGIDKSNASRRVKQAVALGYVRNLEVGAGRPARLEPGEPLPEDQPVLPTVETLADRCGVAVPQQG